MSRDQEPSPRGTGRSGRLRNAVGIFVLGVLATGLVGWALITVVRPASEPIEDASYTFVSVASGEVGSSLNLNAVADWTTFPVGVNSASGIVTSILVDAGGEVSQGSPLYKVNEKAVVVAEGNVPAFRTLGNDLSGTDVEQLQVMLTAAGFYSGPADGKFGSATTGAVKKWQSSLGIEPDGIVGLGDVIFVPELPTRVLLDSELIYRGAPLVGSEIVVLGLPAAPNFRIPVTETQASLMPPGTRVDITSPSGANWSGVTAQLETDEDLGTTAMRVRGSGSADVCADSCGEIPAVGATRLESEIVTVERVQGLVVPTAALTSGADGSVAVIDESGNVRPVSVVVSARGLSVIEGATEGLRVRIPASAEP